MHQQFKLARRLAICAHSFGLFLFGRLGQTQVSESIAAVVPPPEGQVDAPHEGHRLVDGHHLLMVRPQEHHTGHMVGVSHHLMDTGSGNFYLGFC